MPYERRIMISKKELERGILATRKQLEDAKKDPLFMKEVEMARAEQTAYQIVESRMRTAMFRRKMAAYREIFHRDFNIVVALGEDDKERISRSSRDLAFA